MDLRVCVQITWKNIKMIKLVLFDLDGVLIKAKDIHYRALNQALGEEYAISTEEHLGRYDGLPTNVKLEMLVKDKDFHRPCVVKSGRKNKLLRWKCLERNLGQTNSLLTCFKI